MSFKELKKKSGRKSVEALAEEASKMNKPGEGFNDDRFWRPTRDKSDNGFAVIRFLPTAGDENVPWVRVFSHGFQGKGGWYIENCPTTVGGKCPLCEANSELWNSGVEANKQIARDRKRRLQYISNILVLSDPKNPQNEGQVFLYRYGTKIFDKIMGAMSPEFQDEAPLNPFDFWEGANFKLKIRRVKGFVNYDKSEFDPPTPLLEGDDEKLEELWKKQYPLQEFVGAGEFKTYAALSERLKSVLVGGPAKSAKKTAAEDSEESDESPLAEDSEDSEGEALPVTRKPARGATTPTKGARKTASTEDDEDSEEAEKVPAKSEVATEEDTEENSALSYFEALAEED